MRREQGVGEMGRRDKRGEREEHRMDREKKGKIREWIGEKGERERRDEQVKEEYVADRSLFVIKTCLTNYGAREAVNLCSRYVEKFTKY